MRDLKDLVNWPVQVGSCRQVSPSICICIREDKQPMPLVFMCLATTSEQGRQVDKWVDGAVRPAGRDICRHLGIAAMDVVS